MDRIAHFRHMQPVGTPHCGVSNLWGWHTCRLLYRGSHFEKHVHHQFSLFLVLLLNSATMRYEFPFASVRAPRELCFCVKARGENLVWSLNLIYRSLDLYWHTAAETNRKSWWRIPVTFPWSSITWNLIRVIWRKRGWEICPCSTVAQCWQSFGNSYVIYVNGLKFQLWKFIYGGKLLTLNFTYKTNRWNIHEYCVKHQSNEFINRTQRFMQKAQGPCFELVSPSHIKQWKLFSGIPPD